MLTRENIREKLLNIPWQGTATIYNATVEHEKNGAFTILFPDGNILDHKTIQEATSAIFASQKAPDTKTASNTLPAKP